jgi:oligopeptide/dipeptide ABC transporter ATP-binding protein
MDGDLATIEGQPPDLADLPAGCSFHPRCRFARTECLKTNPGLEEKSEGHFVACLMADKESFFTKMSEQTGDRV